MAAVKTLLMPAAFAAGSIAASVSSRDNRAPGVASPRSAADHLPLAFPIARQVNTHHHALQGRAADDAEVPVYNSSSTSYLIELSIGTPGQDVKVAIDTGSDELWVNPDCDDAPQGATERQCEQFGRYSLKKSSSGKDLDQTSSLSYGIGDVEISYVEDDISLPDSSIDLSEVKFGKATQTQDLYEGILGLGFGNGENLHYMNFIDELQDQGATNVKAFTVALGSIDDDNGGMVIFGGVDTHKWVGNLTKLDISAPDNSDKLKRYWVDVQSVGHTTPDGDYKSFDDSSLSAVVDSGTSLTYLPKHVLESISDSLGGQLIQGSSFYRVDCSLIDKEGSIDFTFNGITISVPYYELILELSTVTGGTVCALGLSSSGDTSSSGDGVTPQVSLSLLGDTFMRSAYIVFDQDADALWMAPYAQCGSDTKTIPKDGVAAGNFVGACTESVSQSKYRGAAPGKKTVSTGLAVGAAALAIFQLM